MLGRVPARDLLGKGLSMPDSKRSKSTKREPVSLPSQQTPEPCPKPMYFSLAYLHSAIAGGLMVRRQITNHDGTSTSYIAIAHEKATNQLWQLKSVDVGAGSSPWWMLQVHPLGPYLTIGSHYTCRLNGKEMDCYNLTLEPLSPNLDGRQQWYFEPCPVPDSNGVSKKRRVPVERNRTRLEIPLLSPIQIRRQRL